MAGKTKDRKTVKMKTVVHKRKAKNRSNKRRKLVRRKLTIFDIKYIAKFFDINHGAFFLSGRSLSKY